MAKKGSTRGSRFLVILIIASFLILGLHPQKNSFDVCYRIWQKKEEKNVLNSKWNPYIILTPTSYSFNVSYVNMHLLIYIHTPPQSCSLPEFIKLFPEHFFFVSKCLTENPPIHLVCCQNTGISILEENVWCGLQSTYSNLMWSTWDKFKRLIFGYIKFIKFVICWKLLYSKISKE